MSYGLMSDVHLHNWSQFSSINSNGVNTRLQSILDTIDKACETITAKGIKNMYIAGDLFHVRGSIAPSVLNPTLDLFKKWIDKGVEFRIIPGNHDLETKDAHAVSNAVQALASIGCVICNKTTVFEDDMVIMLPWYDSLTELQDELKRVRKDVPKSEEHDVIIHAPLNGVLKNLPDHGLDPDMLESLGFYRVFCGHYHNHKSFNAVVYSVGALTHQTWGDVDTLAGFVIVEEDKEIHINPGIAPSFIDYDLTWDEAEAELECSGNYVRVKLGDATESEIQTIRQEITKFGAKGVIVQAVPKPKISARPSSSSSGTTLEGSVKDWIDENVTNDKTEVYSRCESILSDISVL